MRRIALGLIVIVGLTSVTGSCSPKAADLTSQKKSLTLDTKKKDTWMVGKLIKGGQQVGIARLRENPSALPKDYPVLIQFRVETKEQMPNHDELDQFDDYESRMEKMEADGSFLLMACITGEGGRSWLFYAKDRSTSLRFASEFHDAKPKIEPSSDPNWNTYHDYLELAHD